MAGDSGGDLLSEVVDFGGRLEDPENKQPQCVDGRAGDIAGRGGFETTGVNVISAILSTAMPGADSSTIWTVSRSPSIRRLAGHTGRADPDQFSVSRLRGTFTHLIDCGPMVYNWYTRSS